MNDRKSSVDDMKYDYRIAGQVIGKMRTELGMLQEPLSGLAEIEHRHLGENRKQVQEYLCRYSMNIGGDRYD